MNNLIPIEYNNQRILTTQQLAESYGTESDVINKNFNRNKERYVPKKHYYCLENEELRTFKANGQIDVSPNINKLYLWTEKGALLHTKSLNTDVAWEVYDKLVDTYFNVKESELKIHTFPETIDSKFLFQIAHTLEEKEKTIAELKPKAEFFDAVAESKDAIDIGSAAKVLNMGIGRNDLFKFLREQKILMENNQPYQEFIDKCYFRTIEQKYNKPDGSTHINIKTLVYQKGLNYIRKIYASTAFAVIKRA